jgi:putative transposase
LKAGFTLIDLYSRAVVGWSMKSSMATEIVLDALLMAVWRRKPKQAVIIHSDQGSQLRFKESLQHHHSRRE